MGNISKEQRQILKDKKDEKSLKIRINKIEVINNKINMSSLSTQKKIFTYLYNTKIEYNTKDNKNISVNMCKLNNNQLVEINKIIKDNEKHKITQNKEILCYDTNLTLFGDD